MAPVLLTNFNQCVIFRVLTLSGRTTQAMGKTMYSRRLAVQQPPALSGGCPFILTYALEFVKYNIPYPLVWIYATPKIRLSTSYSVG